MLIDSEEMLTRMQIKKEMNGNQPLPERSSSQGEELLDDMDGDLVPGIHTGEDVVQFYARYGQDSHIKFFYLVPVRPRSYALWALHATSVLTPQRRHRRSRLLWSTGRMTCWWCAAAR